MTHSDDARTYLDTLRSMAGKAEKFLTDLEAVLAAPDLPEELRAQYEETKRDATAGWNAMAWAIEELKGKGN